MTRLEKNYFVDTLYRYDRMSGGLMKLTWKSEMFTQIKLWKKEIHLQSLIVASHVT